VSNIKYSAFNITTKDTFLLHDATQSAVMPQYVVCPSERPSAYL